MSWINISKYYSNKDQNKHSESQEHVESYANNPKETQPCHQTSQGLCRATARLNGQRRFVRVWSKSQKVPKRRVSQAASSSSTASGTGHGVKIRFVQFCATCPEELGTRARAPVHPKPAHGERRTAPVLRDSRLETWPRFTRAPGSTSCHTYTFSVLISLNFHKSYTCYALIFCNICVLF